MAEAGKPLQQLPNGPGRPDRRPNAIVIAVAAFCVLMFVAVVVAIFLSGKPAPLSAWTPGPSPEPADPVPSASAPAIQPHVAARSDVPTSEDVPIGKPVSTRPAPPNVAGVREPATNPATSLAGGTPESMPVATAMSQPADEGPATRKGSALTIRREVLGRDFARNSVKFESALYVEPAKGSQVFQWKFSFPGVDGIQFIQPPEDLQRMFTFRPVKTGPGMECYYTPPDEAVAGLLLRFVPGTEPGTLICQSFATDEQQRRVLQHFTVEIGVAEDRHTQRRMFRLRIPSGQKAPICMLDLGFHPVSGDSLVAAKASPISGYPWPALLGVRDDTGLFFKGESRTVWLKTLGKREWGGVKNGHEYRLSISGQADRPVIEVAFSNPRTVYDIKTDCIAVARRETIASEMEQTQETRDKAAAFLAEKQAILNRMPPITDYTGSRTAEMQQMVFQQQQRVQQLENRLAELKSEQADLVNKRQRLCTTISTFRGEFGGVGPICVVDPWGTPVLTLVPRIVFPSVNEWSDWSPSAVEDVVDILGGKK